MTYLINNSSITLFLSDHSKVKVDKTDHRYPKIIETFELPTEEQEDAVRSILAPTETSILAVEHHDGFEIRVEVEFDEPQVYYQGEKLPKALQEKIVSIMRDGLPLTHFQKFWENLKNNPSSTSINELMYFLEYKELPITEDGCFLAYKGLNSDYYSVHGNKDTQVLQGTVNGRGHIFNGVGEKIEVLRRCVDDNREVGCSTGLHVGSAEYGTSFGAITVIVKVNPADVVSVPSDCSNQKCRVCKYEVIAPYEREITASVVDEEGEDNIVPNSIIEREAFIERVDDYLFGKIESGADEVTVRQIQNSFSPAYPSREKVLDALQELSYTWEVEDGYYIVRL